MSIYGKTMWHLEELRDELEPLDEAGALHWVRQKFGAAKAAAHRAFVRMVRKDPAAHRRKMRQDKRYHQRHKWHDALMRRTARRGFRRVHERDPGQAFADLPFELRVTSGAPTVAKEVGDWTCPKCGFKGMPKRGGTCPKCGARMAMERADSDSMKVQTLIFKKSRFDREAAVKWATSHNFKASKVDETENSYRLRQRDPGEFETFRTITFKPGIKAVVAKR